MNTHKINRLEIIDHSKCMSCNGLGLVREGECPTCNGMGSPGRQVVMWNNNKFIGLDFQDDGRTLKIFVSEKEQC